MQVDGIADRTALVTGSARAIGRATAEALAANGARVVILDLNKASCESVAAELNSRGFHARGIACDVSQEAQVEEAFREVREEFGGIDILVNNAGIIQFKPIAETTLDDWERMMAVNLRGAFLCSREVMPHMKEQRWGKIVNVGSSAGRNGGSATCAAYAVSKAGVMCLTKTLATELASYGVNVNAVAPALIETGMIKEITSLVNRIPLGRLGTVNDVASVIAFLCSADAAFLTGEIVDINGGFLID